MITYEFYIDGEFFEGTEEEFLAADLDSFVAKDWREVHEREDGSIVSMWAKTLHRNGEVLQTKLDGGLLIEEFHPDQDYKFWFVNPFAFEGLISKERYENWGDEDYHREDGPARIWGDGRKEWWLDGRQVSEEEFDRVTRS